MGSPETRQQWLDRMARWREEERAAIASGKHSISRWPPPLVFIRRSLASGPGPSTPKPAPPHSDPSLAATLTQSEIASLRRDKQEKIAVLRTLLEKPNDPTPRPSDR
jgi:hypothetical protein